MDQCVFCGRSERVEHIFLFCPFARTIWEAVRDHVQLKLDRESFSSMKRWIFAFLGSASPLQATTMVVTCWHIWEARNDARNGRDRLEPARIVSKITVYVDNIVQLLQEITIYQV
jgi:hypothetical protein